MIWPAILGTGILLTLAPLASNPLHPDEALYAYWARLIAGGQDMMLNSVPVDKPPLFIYLLAAVFKALGPSETAARLPSLAAHLATIGLTFGLGQALYQRRVGLLAALLVALSPFNILFAATALTDPLLTAWVMAAALAATRRKPALAGLGLGLAAATKQQGVFFLPLILGLLALPTTGEDAFRWRAGGKRWLTCLAVFGAGLALPLIWDAARSYRPGFWLQSSLSYGPVSFGPAQFTDRLAGFLELLKFAAANSTLNLIFVVGLPLLLLAGLWRPARLPGRQADWTLAGFASAFVLLHALVTFQVWDRYLLGLIPLLALLLARILHLPALLLKLRPAWVTTAAAILVIALMAAPARRAAQSGYPIGGDHGAFYGAAEVSAYLRGHAGANVTLYHHWLGAHWRYYLFSFPYDFRFWQSADDLARQAAANAGETQFVAFPAWQSTTPARLALSERGLALQPVFKTFKPDGAPAIYLYQIIWPSN